MELTTRRYRPATTEAAEKIRSLYDRGAEIWNENSIPRRIEIAERALAVLEILLGLRFAFQLFAVPTWNPVVLLDYIITFPFVLPFYGLSALHLSLGIILPLLETLTAIVIWAVATWVGIGFARMRLQKRQEQQNVRRDTRRATQRNAQMRYGQIGYGH